MLTKKDLMKQIQSCGVEICRQWIVNNLKPVELDKIGVYYTYDKEPSDKYKEGVVVGYKNLKANSKVKQGSNIVVLISSGESGILIEDYKKRNVRIVQSELEVQGLKVITTAKKISTEF